MLIWTRWGLGILILSIFIAMIPDIILQVIMAGKYTEGMLTSYSSTPLMFFIAGVIMFFIGRKLNNPSNDKELIDNQTGETYLLKKRHTVFFLNVEYFGILFIIIGIVEAIALLLK